MKNVPKTITADEIYKFLIDKVGNAYDGLHTNINKNSSETTTLINLFPDTDEPDHGPPPIIRPIPQRNGVQKSTINFYLAFPHEQTGVEYDMDKLLKVLNRYCNDTSPIEKWLPYRTPPK